MYAIKPIPYQNSLNPKQRDALAWIASHTSEKRPQPFHFVGRVAELTNLHEAVEEFDKHGEDSPRVITGAPGAGKTSLVLKFASELREKKNQIVPVFMESGELAFSATFAIAFLNAITKDARSIADIENTTTETGANLGVTAKVTLETARESALHRLAHGENVWGVCGELIKQGLLKRMSQIVMIVDEAQKMADTPDCRLILQGLLGISETATKPFHVLPIFSGLLNTPDVIGSIGYSRPGFEARMLGELSQKECSEAVEKFANRTDVGLRGMFTDRDRRILADALATASEGWPRHLHCYMLALAARIARDFDSDTLTSRLNVMDVLNEGHIARIQYNRRRLAVASKHSLVRRSLSTLAKNLPPEAPMSLDVISDAVAEGSNSAFPIPSDDIETVIIPRLVEAGILQPHKKTTTNICSLFHLYIHTWRMIDARTKPSMPCARTFKIVGHVNQGQVCPSMMPRSEIGYAVIKQPYCYA